jgi:hypothetical protein
LWHFVDVNRQITIRRLLAIIMIAGLVLAPLSSPVMAGATGDASMSASMSAMADDMSMSAALGSTAPDQMAGDMPCCPSKAPMPIGCDKCIFMAACMTNCFVGMTVAVFQPLFAVSAGSVRPQNQFRPDGRGQPPPEHPPRTLV